MENSNLPMKVNNNFALTIESKRQIKRIIEGFKKVAQIALDGVVAFAGLGISVLGRTNWWRARHGNLGSSND